MTLPDYRGLVQYAVRSRNFRSAQVYETLPSGIVIDFEEVLKKAPLEPWVEDGGPGAGLGVHVEPEPFVVEVSVGRALTEDELPEDGEARVWYRYGGCDGEHSGRCGIGCDERTYAVTWKVAYQQEWDGSVFIVFEGTPYLS